jgi:mannosylglycoprotein endo-beta-mannosidase
MQIYEEEEAFWFDGSSEKWLLEGDNKTTYFHRIANSRKRKNTMYSLKKDDTNIQDTSDLLDHATEYYKPLFGLGEGNNMALDANIWSVREKLNEEDNEVLNEPFSETEVKIALDCMVKNKAPGPDGIPVEFFQKCWEIVKHDVMHLFHDWHGGDLNLYQLNFV